MRALIVVASLAATLITGLSAADAESTFRNHPLEYWKKRLHDSSLAARQNAAAAFAEMDPAVAKEAFVELVQALRDDDPRVRFLAARTLGRIGADAKPALSELFKLVAPDANVYVASAAAVAIAGIDLEFPALPDVVRVLVRSEQPLGDSLKPSPSLSGEFLERFPELSVRLTVPLLESDDTVVRRNAARVLASAGPPARESGETALLKTLQDPDESVRGAAVDALYRMRSGELGQAVPVLVKLVASREFPVKDAAAIFRPYAGEVCPRLIRELEGKSVDEQADLVSTLGLLRETSLPMLVAALDDGTVSVRIGAAAALATMGNAASAAIPGLLRMTKDADPGLQLRAAESLVRIDRRRKHLAEWQPVLERAVAENRPNEQRRALAVLKELGPSASGAAQTLVAAIAAASGPLRVEMAVVLVRVDRRRHPVALPILLEALDDPTRPLESELLRTLGDLGSIAERALPRLRLLSQDDKQPFGELLAVIRALTRIERAEIVACQPIVLEMLKQESRESPRCADLILVMTEWGPEAKSSVSAIREFVISRRVPMRRHLAGIGPPKVATRNRIAAAVALVLIDGDEVSLKFIRQIVASPDESDACVHLLDLVGRLGPTAKPLAKEIRPLLRHRAYADDAYDILEKIAPAG
jgi:HEAT repeat protein